MENPIYFGAMLMIIGMTTVFVILALVVLAGKATILFTNRIEQAPAAGKVQTIQVASFDKPKIAAITAALEIITEGRGRITEINKID
jgi:oxaloacetate decarboxylase gamma subunit